MGKTKLELVSTENGQRKVLCEVDGEAMMLSLMAIKMNEMLQEKKLITPQEKEKVITILRSL